MKSQGKFRVLAILCTLIVAFNGYAQAVHVHTQNSSIRAHDCSICSVAHSGVLSSTAYQLIPISVRAVVVVGLEVARSSAGVVLSHRIRPPPTV
jgi:hypothetical protein